MRKILSVITTTLLLAACTQDKTFVLRGSGLDLPDGTVVGLSSHEMGFEQLGETVVKDGAFELHADITTPVYALLTTNNLNLNIAFFNIFNHSFCYYIKFCVF